MIKLISLNHFVNAFCPTILMFIFFFFGLNSQATELGVLASLTLVITQIFSSNKRTIVISTLNISLLYEVFYFRILFSFIILLIIITTIYNTEVFSLLNLNFIFLCVLFWINELLLTLYEIKKDKRKLFINLLLFLFFFLTVCFIFILKIYDYIPLILFIFSLGILSNFFLIKNFSHIYFIKKLNSNKLLNLIKKNIFDYSFISSFSLIVSVLVWRLFIVNNFEKNEAIIYFICFAIASFPATFFNNYIGISLIKKKIKILDYKEYILIYFIISYIFMFLKSYFNLDFENQLAFKILTISLIGTLLMITGVNLRIKILNSIKNKNRLFKLDFIYGLIISAIIPIIIYLKYNHLVIFAYMFGSIITILFYYCIFVTTFKIRK